ncbi:MAG: hypothetical protein WDW36_008937 [Sanguina aurantia]
MEDRHTVVASLRLLSPAGLPLLDDGVQRSLAAVYDGHNGSRAAELAASRLHLLLAADPALRYFTGDSKAERSSQELEESAVTGAMCRAFHSLDEAILAEARSEGLRDGATAVVVMRLGDVLYAAHAGDSRAVLCRQGGAAERLTEDHKPNLPGERARVAAVGGRVEFQRCWRVISEARGGRPGSGLAVSRSFGDIDFKEPQRMVECEPDVCRVVPRVGDPFVLLASDGLFDVLSDQEAVDCADKALQGCIDTRRAAALESGGSAAPLRESEARIVAEALLARAIAKGTMDNVTAVVMLLGWD